MGFRKSASGELLQYSNDFDSNLTNTELLTPTMKIKKRQIEVFYKDQTAQSVDDEAVV